MIVPDTGFDGDPPLPLVVVPPPEGELEAERVGLVETATEVLGLGLFDVLGLTDTVGLNETVVVGLTDVLGEVDGLVEMLGKVDGLVEILVLGLADVVKLGDGEILVVVVGFGDIEVDVEVVGFGLVGDGEVPPPVFVLPPIMIR